MSYSGETSQPFTVAAGVKQGCVLAPVIFNLFLSAVTRVGLSGVRSEDCITVNYRLDGNLFNLRRLKARTRTESVNVFDLQYADDAALVGGTTEGLQRSLDSMAQAYERAGLGINTNKTEVLMQLDHPQVVNSFQIGGQELKNVHQFKYLGSLLTSSCGLEEEVQRRIGLAAASFGKLSRRVFYNKDLRLHTKVKVYKAICISILLYGCEAWVPY